MAWLFFPLLGIDGDGSVTGNVVVRIDEGRIADDLEKMIPARSRKV